MYALIIAPFSARSANPTALTQAPHPSRHPTLPDLPFYTRIVIV